MGFFGKDKSGPGRPRRQNPLPGLANDKDAGKAPDVSEVLADCVVRHFPDGARDGLVVDTGLRRPQDATSVRIAVRADPPAAMGPSLTTVSVYFEVSGGPFGPVPVFASASGYGAADVEATITGGCSWSCTFRPLARAACGLDLGPESGSVVDQVVRRPDGQQLRLLFDGWSRVLGSGDVDAPALMKRVSTTLSVGAPGLSAVVVGSVLIPAPARDRASLLSTFVMEMPKQRVVEIKLDGMDQQPAAGGLFQREGASLAGPSSAVLVRELAVLIPEG